MNTITPDMRGLYKRGQIYWMAYKAASGVIRESTGTSDRRRAEAVLAKRRTEVFEGRWTGRLRDVRFPLRKAIEEFLTVYAEPRKVSWREDALILNRFAEFVGPNACLQDIDRRLIERFQMGLLGKNLSKTRVNRYVAALKCFFNRFIDWEKIEVNPCRGIKLYPETARTHWLEAGQIQQLLDHCSARLKPIVQVALLTGLRLGDILRLTWERIDFDQRLIRLTQGKTQTDLILPMSEALVQLLQAVPTDKDCSYVFHQGRKPLRRFGWVRPDFIKARRAAGLPTTHFHDLRHTAATLLRRAGRDLQVVQQFLGHKSIRMTLRYSHVHPTELREAVNKLGERIASAGAGHFTITSQSGSDLGDANAEAVQNETHFQSKSADVDLPKSKVSETVKA
jgi:integrase